MKIAHILSSAARFPLTSHHARYNWAMQLALLQSAAGHDVTLYCDNSSYAKGVLVRGVLHKTGDLLQDNIATFSLALRGDHDIYHSHYDNLHYELASETNKPIVFTQHWWPNEDTVWLANNDNTHHVWAVPPTKYMYNTDVIHGIPTKGHIYHGVDLRVFSPKKYPSKTGRLLSASRITPQKHIEVAIQTALDTHMGLDIAGKVTKTNLDYWGTLQPLIDGRQIRYIGEKNHKELIDYYSSAQAVLFPSDATEPFGLVAIESQACGTPVIMQRGGSRSELIIEGKTGFLCDSRDDFAQAVTQSKSLLSDDCIKFAQQFNVRTMAHNYEELYKDLLTH